MRFFSFFLGALSFFCLRAQDYTVNLTGFTFDPPLLTINVGETVNWVSNTGTHNVNGSTNSFPANPEGFSSGSPQPAPWTFSHTFNTPGVYAYACDPHISLGMLGSVIVLPASSAAGLVITGVMDGPLAGGLPKVVELTAVEDIPDLSAYGIGSANNGGGTDGVEFTFPPVSLPAGACLTVSNDSAGFFEFFGYYPDYVSSFATAVNGDDAVELFKDSLPIDVFGEIDVDGTGTAWEYLDGWVYRVNGTGPDGTSFNPANWIYSGINALDGAATNASAAVPYPACSYMGTAPSEMIANNDAGSTNQDVALVVHVLANDFLPNPVVSLAVISQPANGTTSVNGLESISYTPNAGFCGDTDVFTYEVCDNTSCDTATVSIEVICPAAYPLYNIADVIADSDGNYIPDSIGKSCEVQGIVYGVNLRGLLGVQFTLIDENDPDAGIGVYNNTENFGYLVNEGDKVAVRGVVDQYSGLTQIAVEDIEVLGSGTLHAPTVVSDLDESTESKLVRINNLYLTDPSTWDDSGASFNVEATNGTTNYQIRIDSDVNIAGTPAPPALFDIIGLGGQFDPTDPYDSGYQLLPRYLDDIINIVNVRTPDLSGHFSVGPNPFAGFLRVETSIPVQECIVQDITGNLLYADQPAGLTWTIETNQWPAGIYIISFRTEAGTWTTRVSRQ